jgi:hypothetical protein
MDSEVEQLVLYAEAPRGLFVISYFLGILCVKRRVRVFWSVQRVVSWKKILYDPGRTTLSLDQL